MDSPPRHTSLFITQYNHSDTTKKQYIVRFAKAAEGVGKAVDGEREMAATWGKEVYSLYRAATRAATPTIHVFVHWRRLRGLEHPSRWPERFGRPSSPRPPGPLLWFHAVSLGEGMAAIPIIKHCVLQNPNFVVLMTTTTTSAFEVIKDQLPEYVIYQFAPLDIPAAVDNFLLYWNPVAVFLLESELWPNLIISASRKGIAVALLNARMSFKSFRSWSQPVALPLISLMLSKLSLIASLSTVEAVHFQLLGAPPFIINFAGDLKYAVGDFDISQKECKKVEDLKLQLTNRPIWMAASLHRGEEEVMLWVHRDLMKIYPDLVTILVTRHPLHGQQISMALKREGLNVALRSRSEMISPSTSLYVVDTLGVHLLLVEMALKREGLNVALRSRSEMISPSTSLYVVDTLGELRTLYKTTPIAVIGGSFLPGLAGHNVSEAAAAGCAVLTGPHVGHFSRMISEMLQLDSSSVLRVRGKEELSESLKELLGNANALKSRQRAAKQAFSAVSKGVVHRVWSLMNDLVLREAGED